jgi:uncharacterized protein (TIGR02996 family)
MTDLEALYRAILDQPDDDTPRLIYADALEDTGGAERAALIRLQVEAARGEEYDPAAIRVRCFRGNAPSGIEWLAELPELPDGLQWAALPFRRGFLSEIEARDGAAFVAHAAQVCALAPIDSLRFTATHVAEADALRRCESLARIARLEFPDGLSGPFARQLLNSPHLTRLTELVVGAGMTVQSAAQALVRSRAFGRLTSLSWRDDHRRGGSIVTELTRHTHLLALKRLDLSGNRITAERVTRLVASPALASVEVLNLSDNNLGPEGLQALAAARLPQLRSLHLAQSRPEEAGTQALVEADFLGNLRSLNLASNNLNAWAARVLAQSPSAANLRVLDLHDNRIGDSGAAALAASPYFAGLLHLDLASNALGDAAATALVESPHLGELIALDLGGNTLSESARDRLRERFGERVLL